MDRSSSSFGRQPSRIEKQASKLRPKQFKKDYTIHYDMFQVVRDGNMELLDRLLNEERKNTDSRWTGWTLLHRAAETGQSEVCQLLLQRGADVNARTIRGWHTPLHLALSSGYLETSLLLVDYGADTKKKNKYKKDPAAYAVSKGYNILAAEFNQTLFNKRVSAISHGMTEAKERGEDISSVPSGAMSRQSSMSWQEWGSMSHDARL